MGMAMKTYQIKTIQRRRGPRGHHIVLVVRGVVVTRHIHNVKVQLQRAADARFGKLQELSG
jgi:hypothetical protein